MKTKNITLFMSFLFMTLACFNLNAQGVKIYKNNGTVVDVLYSELDSIVTYEYEEEITSGQEVDLGLSVNWGGWNVGASSPEQYGCYYAWGETKEKSSYGWPTYNFWSDKNGNGGMDPEEVTNIGSNISGTQYDVARKTWGGSWRMPTQAEFEELISKCTWTWYQYKGVDGYKVTGPNGNSIFLPAGGGYSESYNRYEGVYGNYWSASMNEGDTMDHAWYLSFGAEFYDSGVSRNRSLGRTVRPVK